MNKCEKDSKIEMMGDPVEAEARGPVNGLLPCPFCGCETSTLVDERNVVVLNDIFAARHCMMECDHCGARGASVMCQSEQYQGFDNLPIRAVEKWNERINATGLWNRANKYPGFHETNAVYGALRELESMGAISLGK